jgi:hypothetical protein
MAPGRKLIGREFRKLVEEYFVGFDQASSYVQWSVIRNNSAFLRKRKLGTLTTVS